VNALLTKNNHLEQRLSHSEEAVAKLKDHPASAEPRLGQREDQDRGPLPHCMLAFNVPGKAPSNTMSPNP
jgi:hypothetical protein